MNAENTIEVLPALIRSCHLLFNKIFTNSEGKYQTNSHLFTSLNSPLYRLLNACMYIRV